MRPAHSAREIAVESPAALWRPISALASMRPAHSAREISSVDGLRALYAKSIRFNEARAFSAGNRGERRS